MAIKSRTELNLAFKDTPRFFFFFDLTWYNVEKSNLAI